MNLRSFLFEENRFDTDIATFETDSYYVSIHARGSIFFRNKSTDRRKSCSGINPWIISVSNEGFDMLQMSFCFSTQMSTSVVFSIDIDAGPHVWMPFFDWMAKSFDV